MVNGKKKQDQFVILPAQTRFFGRENDPQQLDISAHQHFPLGIEFHLGFS